MGQKETKGSCGNEYKDKKDGIFMWNAQGSKK